MRAEKELPKGFRLEGSSANPSRHRCLHLFDAPKAEVPRIGVPSVSRNEVPRRCERPARPRDGDTRRTGACSSRHRPLHCHRYRPRTIHVPVVPGTPSLHDPTLLNLSAHSVERIHFLGLARQLAVGISGREARIADNKDARRSPLMSSASWRLSKGSSAVGRTCAPGG